MNSVPMYNGKQIKEDLSGRGEIIVYRSGEGLALKVFNDKLEKSLTGDGISGEKLRIYSDVDVEKIIGHLQQLIVGGEEEVILEKIDSMLLIQSS